VGKRKEKEKTAYQLDSRYLLSVSRYQDYQPSRKAFLFACFSLRSCSVCFTDPRIHHGSAHQIIDHPT